MIMAEDVASAAASSSSSAAWEPFGAGDVGAVGIATCVDAAVACTSLYIVLYRSWPPYKARMPSLVLYTGLATLLATAAVPMRHGMWGRAGREEPRPVGCNVQAFLAWLGGGGLFCCGFLRLYRQHKVLVHHNDRMWPITMQLVLLMLPFCLPPSLNVVQTSLVSFDVGTQECQRASMLPEAFGFGVMVVLSAASIVLTFRLRVARVQAPEEVQAAIAVSTALALAVVALPLVHVELESFSGWRRRALLACAALFGAAVFTPPLLRPLVGYIADEDTLEASGEYGFGKTRGTEEISEMFRMRLKINDLASTQLGHRGVTAKFTAMAKFYRDTLDRDENRDYFHLQASTMKILGTYVREGAPMFVPLSSDCRAFTLGSRASSSFIFGRAREEVLEKMGGGKKLAQPVAVGGTETSYDSWSASGGFFNRHTIGDVFCDGDDDDDSNDHDLEEHAQGGSTPVATPSPPSRSTAVVAQAPQQQLPSELLFGPQEGQAPLPLARPPRPPGVTVAARRTPGATHNPMHDGRATQNREGDDDDDTEDVSPSVRRALLSGTMMAGNPSRKPRREAATQQTVGGASSAAIVGTGEIGDKGGGGGGGGNAGDGGSPGSPPLVGVSDVHAAFGLRSNKGNSDTETNTATSSGISKKGGSMQKDKEEEEQVGGGDLAEVSKAISNPLFGHTSRAVGRQPGGKVRPAAARWDYAIHAKNASAVNSNGPVKNGPVRKSRWGRSVGQNAGAGRTRNSGPRPKNGGATGTRARSGSAGSSSAARRAFFTISEKDDEDNGNSDKEEIGNESEGWREEEEEENKEVGGEQERKDDKDEKDGKEEEEEEEEEKDGKKEEEKEELG